MGEGEAERLGLHTPWIPWRYSLKQCWRELKQSPELLTLKECYVGTSQRITGGESGSRISLECRKEKERSKKQNPEKDPKNFCAACIQRMLCDLYGTVYFLCLQF